MSSTNCYATLLTHILAYPLPIENPHPKKVKPWRTLRDMATLRSNLRI